MHLETQDEPPALILERLTQHLALLESQHRDQIEKLEAEI